MMYYFLSLLLNLLKTTTTTNQSEEAQPRQPVYLKSMISFNGSKLGEEKIAGEFRGKEQLTTMWTFDHCSLFQHRLWNPTDTRRSLEIHIFRLDTSDTT